MLKLTKTKLLERLNSYSRDALHRASEICVERGQFEVTIAHVLRALVKQNASDITLMLPRLGLPIEELEPKLDRVLSTLRDGASDLPQFSTLLLELLQDAMTLASGELGEDEIRTGTFLAALVASPDRYCHYFIASEFEALDSAAIIKGFEELTAGSMEKKGEGAAQAPSSKPEAESALQRFGRNLTELASVDEIDPVFCRDAEIAQMMDVLSRRRKNNPILVGDPGVGKTALAEGLALHLAEGNVPPALQGAVLWELDMGALQAGASVKGEFERRLKAVLDEAMSSSQKTILFIDEAHTLIGGGGPAGGGDAANLLKPALARGQLRAIAATTWSEYKRYFEKDAALARRFQLIALDEPDIEDCVTILQGLRSRYEDTHGVYITDAALQAAASLSARYLTGRQLPDKALDVLDTACVRVASALSMRPRNLTAASQHLKIVETRRDNAIRDKNFLAEGRVETLELLDTEIAHTQGRTQALEQAWTNESAQAKNVIALRQKILDDDDRADVHRASLQQAVDAISAQSDSDSRLVPYEVSASLIATIISEWTGIPVAAISGDEADRLLNLGSTLREQIRGQDDAISIIHDRLKTSRLDFVREGTPRGAFLLVGPSGVGKTETAEQLAAHLYGGRQFLTVINMSEYQEKHALSRLIGSPPGYVGYGEGGLLTEAIRKKPYSVVLLDEVEKAHADILNLFLQAFDKGVISDGEGREIDCRNIVFFMTSNLGAEALLENRETVSTASQAALEKAIRPHLASHFKPALLSRLTVLCYRPLEEKTRREIIALKLNNTARQMQKSRNITFSWDESVEGKIDSVVSHSENGARAIDQVIDRVILAAVAEETLERIASQEMLTAVKVQADEDGYTFTFEPVIAEIDVE